MQKIIIIFKSAALVFSLILNLFSHETYTQTYHLSYFYIDGCSNCQAFEEEVLPMIKEEFGEHMEITKYNMDDIETKKIYDETLDKIVGFDEETSYGLGPFIVLDDYFAILGFDTKYKEYYIHDMIFAVKNWPLSKALSKKRYIFKTDT